MKKEKDRQLGSNPAGRDAGPGDNPDSKLEQILVRQAQESADRDAKWAQDAADRNAKWEKMFARYVQESAENRALVKKNHAELIAVLEGIRSIFED